MHMYHRWNWKFHMAEWVLKLCEFIYNALCKDLTATRNSKARAIRDLLTHTLRDALTTFVKIFNVVETYTKIFSTDAQPTLDLAVTNIFTIRRQLREGL